MRRERGTRLLWCPMLGTDLALGQASDKGGISEPDSQFKARGWRSGSLTSDRRIESAESSKSTAPRSELCAAENVLLSRAIKRSGSAKPESREKQN